MTPKIFVKTADITREAVCAIVNAANHTLLGGGGVDGAIHRAGGSAILDACREIRARDYPEGLPTGQAVSTVAGDLPCRYVIHTVGPVYSQCRERCETLLGDCYRNALIEAVKMGCDTVAFPAISTGIYGYPKAEAAKIAYETVSAFLNENPSIEVHFVFHSPQDSELFKQVNQL